MLLQPRETLQDITSLGHITLPKAVRRMLKWGLIALWSRLRYGSTFMVLNEEEQEHTAEAAAAAAGKTANQIAADMQVQSPFLCASLCGYSRYCDMLAAQLTTM